MEKAENIISMSILLFLTRIVSVVFYESHHLSKFTQTQIEIPFELLKKDWGEPDKIIQNRGGNKTIFYNTILNKFVFNVNENEIVES